MSDLFVRPQFSFYKREDEIAWVAQLEQALPQVVESYRLAAGGGTWRYEIMPAPSAEAALAWGMYKIIGEGVTSEMRVRLQQAGY